MILMQEFLVEMKHSFRVTIRDLMMTRIYLILCEIE